LNIKLYCIRCTVDGLKSDLQKIALIYIITRRLDVGWTLVHQVLKNSCQFKVFSCQLEKQLSGYFFVWLYPTQLCIRYTVDGLKSDLQNNHLNLYCRLDVGWTLVHQVK
jgi:hypothetical protein